MRQTTETLTAVSADAVEHVRQTLPGQLPSCGQLWARPEALRTVCVRDRSHPGTAAHITPASINHPGERHSRPATRGVFAVKIFGVDGSGHRRSPSTGDSHSPTWSEVARSETAERIDGQLAVEASTPSHQHAGGRGHAEATSDRRALRSLVRSIGDSRPAQALRPARAPSAIPSADERRRLERDLHDGVQNELVALIVKLALAQEDPDSPPALVEMLAGLEARAQAVRDSVRNVARGIYPSLLADFGLAEALRGQAARAAVDVRLMGTAPRGTEAAEAAVFFACSEAIQNATKYAGHAAQITLRLRHQQGTLAGSHRGSRRDLHPRLQPRTRHCPDHLDALAGGRWVAMSEVILLSLTASLNPTLLAATTPDAPASEPVKTGAGLSVWRVHDQQHARPRNHVYETAGSSCPRTRSRGTEVFLTVVGELLFLGENGQLLAQENWRTSAERYGTYCDEHGIEQRAITRLRRVSSTAARGPQQP